MDESVQKRRDDVEWRRWKETDKSHWVEDKREEWVRPSLRDNQNLQTAPTVYRQLISKHEHCFLWALNGAL
jgi:hypothetical protein